MSLYEKVGGIVPSHNGPDLDLRRHLDDILRDRQLTPVFQPIVDIQFGAILGYEGLIRGPSGGLCTCRWTCFEWLASMA